MKKLLIACGVLLGSMMAAAEIGNLPEEVRHFSDDMRNLLPGAAEVTPSGEGIYTVRDAKRNTIGTLYLERISDDERPMGYAGTIEIAVLFGKDSTVAGVLIGKNQETPSFLNRLRAAKFPERWNGLRMEEIPGREIDAVTGATYSSTAIRTGVRKLAEHYLAEGKKSSEERKSLTKAERVALERERTRLERKVKMHRKILDASERLLEQLRTRKDDELKLGFLAAAEGKKAAQEFAQNHNMIYFNHPRRKGSGKSELERLGEQFRRTKSETDRKNLQKAVLAEYERKLKTIPPHNQEHEKALKGSLERIAVLKRKLAEANENDTVQASAPNLALPALRFRSSEANAQEEKIRRMAEEYRSKRNPALLAALRKEVVRQLAAGIAAMSAEIAVTEQKTKHLQQQLDRLLEDPEEAVRQRLSELTGNE